MTYTVAPELKARFDKIPWGVRSLLLRQIAKWVCDLYDTHGEMAFGIILSESFELTNIAKVEGKENGQPR